MFGGPDSASRYVVAEKSDGVRYALLLCEDAGEPVALLVDRSMRAYQAAVTAPPRFFKGTLLDGEVVLGDGARVFLAFDAVALCGDTTIAQKPLTRRYEALSGAVARTHGDAAERAAAISGSHDTLSVAVKRCAPLTREAVERALRTCHGHASDGLVLTPIVDGVRMWRHTGMFKWKPAEGHTLDFVVRGRLHAGAEADVPAREPGRWSFAAYYEDRGQAPLGGALFRPMVRAGTARAGTAPGTAHAVHFYVAESPLLESLARHAERKGRDSFRGVVEFECVPQERPPDAAPGDPTAVACTAKALRRDKSHANSRRTIESTLVSLLDPVTVEDLGGAVAQT